jgi:hypothetical protein
MFSDTPIAPAAGDGDLDRATAASTARAAAGQRRSAAIIRADKAQ